MRLSRHLSQIFFLRKDFERIKNNKGNGFPPTETSKRGKIGYFAL